MARPTIKIESFTRSKISKKSGVDSSKVVFSTNQDLVQWEARADGQGVGQGLLVGSGGSIYRVGDWNSRIAKYGDAWDRWGSGDWNQFIDNGTGSFIVDDEELTNGDKAYRINVYGKNQSGEWSGYG